MSEVQIALLVLGFIVIIIMILHNWAQLKKIKKRKQKISASEAPTLNDDNDPLFQSSEFKINDLDRSKVDELDSSGSQKMIESNLPDGVNRDIEMVASIVTKSVQNGKSSIFLESLDNLPGVSVYVRNDNEIWSTGEALDESIRYNQVLIVQQLASRKWTITNDSAALLISYIEKINSAIDGNLFWLTNSNILEEAKLMDEFRGDVDKALILKVTPKSDSSFHTGALEDFFNKSDIKVNNKLIHEFIDLENKNVICQLLSLSGKPLQINQESFIQGIVLKMDVPNTPNITHSFNKMISLIKESTKKLNGVLVDTSNKKIDDDYISRVYVHLKKVEQKMLSKKINPGSDNALKIFS
ncbi:MAG: cell division protein ZipA C-terminal FtsZ-binding domain-containing protein [Methylophilaceae bacterium]|nr:cell division protein ZipA C-terminal FtsZ-binding domain-containing protein [Methylophilaceae bacterium]